MRQSTGAAVAVTMNAVTEHAVELEDRLAPSRGVVVVAQIKRAAGDPAALSLSYWIQHLRLAAFSVAMQIPLVVPYIFSVLMAVGTIVAEIALVVVDVALVVIPVNAVVIEIAFVAVDISLFRFCRSGIAVL
jgi:hypothetical protein